MKTNARGPIIIPKMNIPKAACVFQEPVSGGFENPRAATASSSAAGRLLFIGLVAYSEDSDSDKVLTYLCVCLRKSSFGS